MFCKNCEKKDEEKTNYVGKENQREYDGYHQEIKFKKGSKDAVQLVELKKEPSHQIMLVVKIKELLKFSKKNAKAYADHNESTYHRVSCVYKGIKIFQSGIRDKPFVKKI